jgi:hypothetical protein
MVTGFKNNQEAEIIHEALLFQGASAPPLDSVQAFRE